MEVIQERLIAAATLAEETPGMRVEVMPNAVRLSYIWDGSNGRRYTVENAITWVDLEYARVNPLIAGLTSLTKQAAALQ